MVPENASLCSSFLGMVTGEQHCCAFLEFEVREEPDAVHVTITALENARDAADELFAHFIAGVAPHQ